MAILAHALQIVGMFIAPLIIFLTKRESRFVSFHALQALLFQLIYVAAIFVMIVCFMIFAFATIAQQPSAPASHSGPPPALFIFFPLVWLGMMGFWVVSITFAILYSIKAGKGEWAEYPLLGRVARRILKLGPNGVPV